MSKELEEFEEMYNWIYCNIVTTYEDDVKLDKIRKNVKSALQRLESIDNADPSEALTEIFNIIYSLDCGTTYEQDKKLDECRKTIKKALFKAQENEEENYVIYCVNNYHNVYMNYRGEPCNYQSATIFNNKFEAHKFLREKGNYNYYHWSVFNVKDLREDQKHRQVK